jgi:hypothetical protein
MPVPLDHIRPRPVGRLPELAPAPARRRTAEALTRKGLSVAAAQAIADAIVDHGTARHHIANPELRRVPGGDLLAVRADGWVRRLVPDPANMRTGPDRVHPFAVAPGTGGENSRFAPVGAAASEPTGRPELVARAESREHLEWAHDRAAEYVMRVNNWSDSIAAQGVMEEVWVVPTTYRLDDGSPELVVCQTAEGSSRITACRRNTSTNPVEDAYGLKDSALRAQIARINDAIDMGTLDEEGERLARSFVVPVLFIIGFDSADSVDAPPFHVAVSSLVALRHVDRPEPWGEASEMEALADGVLDECQRRRVIRADQRRWLAGSMTRADALTAHLSDDPSVRAAHIAGMFTSSDSKVQVAIRAAVTAQSTRRQIRIKLKNQMAAALIMRALDDGARHRERVRKYMNDAIAQDWHRRPWTPTQRPIDELERAALREVGAVAQPGDDPGPASVELAARAMYPLVAGLQLHGDRGTRQNDQVDRRTPGGVLDSMRRSEHGVRQLAQAVRDGLEGLRIRAVDPDGKFVTEGDGSRIRTVSDNDLRTTFPQAGKATKPRGPVDTPHKRLSAAVAELGTTIETLSEAVDAVAAVGGHGGALVNEEGIAPAHVVAWLRTLEEIRDNLQRWRWIAEARQPASPERGEQGPDADGIEDLDYDALVSLASKAGLVFDEDLEREELIELLIDNGITSLPDDEAADDRLGTGGDEAA